MEREYKGLADVALATRELDNYGEDNVQLNYDTVNDKVWIDPLDSLARSLSLIHILRQSKQDIILSTGILLIQIYLSLRKFLLRRKTFR